MIAIDTNILVRYLVQDDPAQGAMATNLLEQELTFERPALILIVACFAPGPVRLCYE